MKTWKIYHNYPCIQKKMKSCKMSIQQNKKVRDIKNIKEKLKRLKDKVQKILQKVE